MEAQSGRGVRRRSQAVHRLHGPESGEPRIPGVAGTARFIDPHRGHRPEQGPILGMPRGAVSLTVNALIVIGTGSIAGIIAGRSRWATWQRRAPGILLSGVALLLAREVPDRVRI